LALLPIPFLVQKEVSREVSYNDPKSFSLITVLPYGMYLPTIDEYKYISPYYEIFFVIQGIMAPMGCCMYIPYTNMVVTFTLFAILMCKVLQHKLRSLEKLKDCQVRGEIIWCIKYQLKLAG